MKVCIPAAGGKGMNEIELEIIRMRLPDCRPFLKTVRESKRHIQISGISDGEELLHDSSYFSSLPFLFRG